MPINKDFKRLVRARMHKTGESYTAARALLLARPANPRTSEPRHLRTSEPRHLGTPAPEVSFARLAGMSNDAVKASTGCAWASWVAALDHVKAYTWPHRAIAEYVHEKYNVPDWWTQMVTVGYERIKGLRERGQRRGGDYEATRSKSFDVAVGRLYDAFAAPKRRARWLNGATLAVRKATRNRSMRITWGDGTSVELWFTKKARSKSQVQVQCRRLPSRDAAAGKKAYWEERLAALEHMLGR